MCKGLLVRCHEQPVPCCLQAVCFDLVYGWRHFGRLVVLVVCINTGIQMASYGPEPDSWFRAMNALDAIFVALYTIELVLKIGAEKDLRCAFHVDFGETYKLHAWLYSTPDLTSAACRC